MANNNEATLILKIKDLASKGLEEFNKRFVITAGDVIGFAKSIGGSIVDMAKEAINAYKEEELALNQLTTAMVNQGVFTQDLKHKYTQLANSLQDVTTFGDDQIVSAISILQAYSKNKEVTEQLTKATLDFAAAKKIDLKTAAELVGKTIGTETNALSRYGIEISASASAGEKYIQVLNGINSKYQGQAETAAQGLGKTEQLKQVWGDFLSNIGRSIAPFVVQMTEATLSVVKFFNAFLGVDPSTLSVKQLNEQLATLKERLADAKKSEAPSAAAIVANLKNQITEVENALAEINAKEEESARKSVEIRKQEHIEKAVVDQQAANSKLEQEIAMIGASEEQKLQAQIAADQRKFDQATTEAGRLQALKDKHANLDKMRDLKRKDESLKNEQAWQQAKVNIISASANLITELTGQGSKAAFIAQKAAALAQAIVATNLAAAQALAVPPAPNIPLQNAARTAGYINIAAIAASTVKGLATGGIVPATPGGQPFIIGEGGKDEAVIPLDDDRATSRLGGTTVVFNGPIMGNESQAREFAIALDRELLKLRQSNQSVAFETDVI